jgi:hypothetical protein
VASAPASSPQTQRPYWSELDAWRLQAGRNNCVTFRNHVTIS